MKRIASIIFAVITAVAFITCELEPGLARNLGGVEVLAPDAGWSPYYPYEVGKVWAYETVFTHTFDYPEESPIEDTAWTDTFNYTTEVERETVLTGSNPLEVWELKTTTGDTTLYSYVHIDSDSVYGFDNIDDSEPTQVSPAEPGVGDQWVYDNGEIVVYYEVLRDDAEANGYSDCLEIDVLPEDVSMYDEYQNYMYMARNEGHVFSSYLMITITEWPEGDFVMTSEGETRLLGEPGIIE